MDGIDDLDVIRAGGMRKLFGRCTPTHIGNLVAGVHPRPRPAACGGAAARFSTPKRVLASEDPIDVRHHNQVARERRLCRIATCLGFGVCFDKVAAMPGDVRVTAGVAKVLAAFLEDPAADRYGLDLMKATDMPSGTLYPILARLRAAGWVQADWEQTDPEASRPARRYYRLTPEGAVAARHGVAELYQKLDIAAAGRTRGTALHPSSRPGPA